MPDTRMAIEGIGIVGAFGNGIDSLYQALHSGSDTNGRQRGITLDPDGVSAYLCSTEGLEEFFHKRELRRIDHYSKMALLAACLALKDAGRSRDEGGTTGIVVATGYGPQRTTFKFLDSFIQGGDALSSPTQFASSVHNAAAAYIAILLGQTGPSLTVSDFDLPVASGILTAWSLLDAGIVDRVLFGAVDEYSDLLGYCYRRFFGSSEDCRTDPLRFEKQSAIPGEGSVFFILSKDEEKTKYGRIISVQAGARNTLSLAPAGRDLLFLSADGHKKTGRQYLKLLEAGSPFACYTPLYGSLPIGLVFDIAIAGLSIRYGKLFAPPVSFSAENAVPDRQSLDDRSIRCIKMDRNGGFESISIEGKGLHSPHYNSMEETNGGNHEKK